jgi:hypothetical protein
MAFGTVKIDEKEFNFRSSAATELFYKQVFGEDLLVSLMSCSELADIDMENITEEQAAKLTEQTTDMLKVGFIMAMQAKGTKAKDFQSFTELDYYDWLDTMPRFEPDAVSQIIQIYTSGKATSVIAKKAAAEPNE